MTEFHPLRSASDVASLTWQELDKKAEELARNAPSAEMPSMAHASWKDFDEVYEPSDDTYLLIDGIQADFLPQIGNLLKENYKNVVEIGSGSGVPIVYLAKLLPEAKPIAIDINPKALLLTKATAEANGITNLETMETDLASGLLPKYHHTMDIVIFNPPYVPTPDDEVAGNGIEASWAGGERGRRVVDRALPQIADLLSRPHGICYMITVDDNEPEEIAQRLGEIGLDMKPLVRRRARNEFLSVQKITIK